MSMDSFDERAAWLARNILPLEPLLRAWLNKRKIQGIEVDDVVQETYARLSTVKSVHEIRDVRAYMLRAAHSVIIDMVRRSQVVAIHSLSGLEDLSGGLYELDPETTAADRDELSRLAVAIAQLPARTREVFVLRRVHGMSQCEVAAYLGIAESTVEKLMAKGFHRLSEIFGRGGKYRPGTSKDMRSRIDMDYAAREQPGD